VDWGFGFVMMVMGMVITLVTLYLLGWVIRLMIKIFPYKEENEKSKS
jgi:Na+-transporting methylmalonyl-CoA/oxaloacetate decarboxylase gamma subunit